MPVTVYTGYFDVITNARGEITIRKNHSGTYSHKEVKKAHLDIESYFLETGKPINKLTYIMPDEWDETADYQPILVERFGKLAILLKPR